MPDLNPVALVQHFMASIRVAAQHRRVSGLFQFTIYPAGPRAILADRILRTADEQHRKLFTELHEKDSLATVAAMDMPFLTCGQVTLVRQ